jgi:hypothetical protein
MKDAGSREPIDAMLEEILNRASDGLSFDDATHGIAYAVKALRAQLEALSTKAYGHMKPEIVARCAAQTMKATDELYRLVQFAKGAPDSRPDLGGDWLRGLTNAQVLQVQRWVEENQAKETSG